MGDDVDINTLTMEQYMALIRDDIRPGVVKSKIDNDVKFKINSNFMRDLRRRLFIGTDDEDAHEHVQRLLEIVDLFHFLGVTDVSFLETGQYAVSGDVGYDVLEISWSKDHGTDTPYLLDGYEVLMLIQLVLLR
nr:hypothetical protein [Tanacetum cinerariifolium]